MRKIASLVPFVVALLLVGLAGYGTTAFAAQSRTDVSVTVADTSNAQKLKITVMGINARGTDTLANRNAEYVWVRNVSPATVNVKGWKVTDAAGNTTTFTEDNLPSLEATATTLDLPAGDSVIVYSGQGTDTTPENNVHAIYRNGNHYLNNTSGEIVRVVDADGSTVDKIAYDAYGINPTP